MEKIVTSNELSLLIDYYINLCMDKKTQTIEEVSKELGIATSKIIMFIHKVEEFGYLFPSFKGLYSLIIRGTEHSEASKNAFYSKKQKMLKK